MIQRLYPNFGVPESHQEKIAILANQLSLDICGDHPNAFWNGKKHDETSMAPSLQKGKRRKNECRKRSNVSTASSSGTSGIDINHPIYKEFMDFMKSKKESDNNPLTYFSILIDDENTEVFDMNDKYFFLEENDLKWRNEPWQIMARYLDTVSYTTAV
ncbi:hypothetical protein H5410_045219 [Solanum commersonii]|uniref:Uncharacterized protein n=1 Tax=Solanum commersonii TaxID=4109 RepID=A0A9J5X8X6_SOLCO|nr:hypothetical protein H5410_045219 [Solanum commersonii]